MFNKKFSKKLNFLWKIFLNNIGFLSFPYKLTFALTYKCNLKCKTCSIWKKGDKKELTTKEIEIFFRNNSKFSWIDLTGGEIFLRNDIFEIIDIIIKCSPNLLIFHFPTNGQFPHRVKKAIKLISSKSDSIIPVVTISLDGPKLTNDYIRGKKGAWENSIKTYKLLKKQRNCIVFFGMTLSKYNYEYNIVSETVNKIKNEVSYFKKNDIHVNLAFESSHYYKNTDSFKINIDDYKKILTESSFLDKKLSIKSWLERIYFKNLEVYLYNDEIPLECQSLNASCFLNPYGNVYPCISWNKIIGNIKDYSYSLKNLRKGSKYNQVRKKIKLKKCPNCWTACEAYPTILGSLLKGKLL